MLRTVAPALLLTTVAYAADPALLDLAQGINAYNQRDYQTAIRRLRPIRVPSLADYIVYHLASSEQQTGDFDGAIQNLDAYRASRVNASPLAGKIALLHGRTLLDKHDPAESARALEILQSDYKLLPQPDGDFALGLAYEALGEQPQAALAYGRVYYAYPNTDLAAQSFPALERLRTTLGKDFPEAPPVQQLERCEKWLSAREYYKARQEYSVLADRLTGPEKDDARVGIGAAQYLAGDAASALRYLKELKATRPEAEAARLYYLTEAARKSGDDAAMMDAVKQLEEHFPQSPFRLKAMIAAGNRYVASGDREHYEPLFKSASDTFPSENSTAAVHWKITWDAWLSGRSDRVDLLREQVQRYPGDSRSSSALYFMGRAAESEGKYGEARAYYDRLSAQYPHYFYGVLGRERAHEPKIAMAAPDEAVSSWLSGIGWPMRRDLSGTESNPATRQRIERARLLLSAGLPDLSEAELRFGAKTDNEQPQLLALELAHNAPSPFRALRIMKSLSADYLALPTDNASIRFWQMLFPLPYKDELFRNARAHGLDPYYVAGLIRQESEFNPEARSPSNAYGLMQLIPSTGRLMGRQQGMKFVSTSMLLNPSVNIRLGTQYLRGQLNSWNGDWYQTLAAYDAGPGRVREWLMGINYREPVEFVESIPFNETREYVQAVLRNADMYRELYSGKHAAELEQSSEPVKPVQTTSLTSTARQPSPKKPASPARRVATKKKRRVPA